MTVAPTPAPVADSAWVRPPIQDRARRTVDRVLQVGADLLRERGLDGFAVSEVCRRARLSPGALYERFETKDNLFLAIHERELTRLVSGSRVAFAVGDRWSGLPTGDLVEAAVVELGAFYLADRELLRAFVLRAAVDPVVRSEASRLSRDTQRAMTDLLMTRAGEYPHPDPEAAVRAAFRLASDSLAWRTAFGMDFAALDTETPEHWVVELGVACRGYLLTPPRADGMAGIREHVPPV